MNEETAETSETAETTRRASIAYVCGGLAFLAFVASGLLSRAGLDTHYAQAIGAFAAGLLVYPAMRHIAISQGRRAVSFARWIAVVAVSSAIGFLLIAQLVERGLEKLFGW